MPSQHESVADSLRAIRRSPPLLLFLGMATLSDLAMGVNGAMAFIFFDTYLGIGASFSLIFVTALAVSTLSLKLWEVVVRRTSKRLLLLACLLIGVVHGCLVLWMTPGPFALPIYIGFLTLYYILSAGRDVAMYAMIGDIVDYDTLKTGSNRAGQFTSAWMVFRKLAYALGPVIGLYIAGAAGYDPSASHNGALAVVGLKAANGYIPALLLAAAALLAMRFPLTEQRHRIIRQRLTQRAARASRSTTSTSALGGLA
jgi:Na+/melibiose symporter-like transporter